MDTAVRNHPATIQVSAPGGWVVAGCCAVLSFCLLSCAVDTRPAAVSPDAGATFHSCAEPLLDVFTGTYPGQSAAQPPSDPSPAVAAPDCPTPVIVATPGAVVEVGTTVVLHGGESRAAMGHKVVTYKWDLIGQPVGARPAVLAPGSTQENRTIVWQGETAASAKGPAHLVGDYRIRLSVADEAGRKSCQPAELTVRMVPPPGLYVELSWDGPSAASSPLDSDLDLHVADAAGYAQAVCAGSSTKSCLVDGDKDGQADPWYSRFDALATWSYGPWTMAHPEATQPAVFSDDGKAPVETGVVPCPQPGTDYAIAVHVWNSQHAGPIHANLRIFHDRTPVAAFEQLLSGCDLWVATWLTFPAGEQKAVPGGNLAPPSAGKVVPSYRTKLAGVIGGPCKDK